jgi:hypothetical protein
MPAARRVAALALALLAAGAAPACQSLLGRSAPEVPNPVEWAESEPFRCLDEEVLWEVSKGVLARQGFRIDDDLTTWKGRRIVTAWDVQLSMRYQQGMRRRRFLELRADRAKPGWYTVRASVTAQKNEEVSDPLNPAAAQWRDAPADAEESERLAYTVASKFRDQGASPEFESR